MKTLQEELKTTFFAHFTKHFTLYDTSLTLNSKDRVIVRFLLEQQIVSKEELESLLHQSLCAQAKKALSFINQSDNTAYFNGVYMTIGYGLTHSVLEVEKVDYRKLGGSIEDCIKSANGLLDKIVRELYKTPSKPDSSVSKHEQTPCYEGGPCTC